MVIPKDALKSMLNRLDENDAVQIGTETAAYTKDIRLLMRNKDDVEGFLSIMRQRSQKSGFQVRETSENGTRKFIIQHDMGTNWSLYAKSLYGEIIHSLGGTATIEYTPNTLIIEIK